MYIAVLLVVAVSSVNAGIPLKRTTTKIAQTHYTRDDYLLPTNLRPTLYQIEIDPNFETETYRGRVNITLFVDVATNKVVLHQEYLRIDAGSILLLNENGNTLNSVIDTSYSGDDRHFYTITFENHLEAERYYILTINSFTGPIRHDAQGVFLGKYYDSHHGERTLISTQFEPTYARRAFPCFDEPALKAEFEVTLIRPADYNSLSNMPKISETEISNGRYQDKFARSVKMSTYLVAFVISDYANVSQENHRVFGPPASIAANEGDFGLRTGIKALNGLSKYLNIPYTLPKMDQVSLPDLGSTISAMENWGLVTYGPGELMGENKYSIGATILHEFTHQWFGNLVSPIWWSYLWLNEGFAAYFDHYMYSIISEDINMNYAVSYYVEDALQRDSYSIVQSMNHEVGAPSEVQIKFLFSYSKPSAVIRMVSNMISSEVFRKGLNIYLTKMQFRAAHPQDLYSSWQQALDETDLNPFPKNENIASVMKTWESNAGYPLITVHRNYNKGSVIISQKRFISDNPNNNDPSIWHVPITYTTSSRMNFTMTLPTLWLTTKSMEVVLDDLNPEDWLIVNIQLNGFYRVNYDRENWRRITNALNSTESNKIHEINRAQVRNDARALSAAGLLEGSVYIGMFKSIMWETDYVPLKSFVDSLEYLDVYMSNTNNYEEFKEVVLNLLKAAVDSVGFESKDDDSYITHLTRDLLLTLVCNYGRWECRKYGLAKIKEWNRRANEVAISNVDTPLLCAALKSGEECDWNLVFNKYVDEENPSIRQRLLKVLSCRENYGTLDRILDAAKHNSIQQKEPELLHALMSICNSSTYGRDYLYSYVKDNWNEVSTSLTTKDFESVVKCIASKFSTRSQYDDMRALLEHDETGLDHEEVLDITQSNIDAAQKLLPAFLNWISESQI